MCYPRGDDDEKGAVSIILKISMINSPTYISVISVLNMLGVNCEENGSSIYRPSPSKENGFTTNDFFGRLWGFS